MLVLLLVVNTLLFNACSGHTGGLFMQEDKRADARMEQIVSAIKDKDKEALKTLFSQKALNEASDFDDEIDYLFDLIQGDIVFWERDGWASSKSITHGKKTLMIRCSLDIETDKDTYSFFVIDYNIDTLNPDNQGVFMLELITDTGNLKSWQDRMRAGIYIH